MDLMTISKELATSTFDVHILSPKKLPLYVKDKDGKLSLTTDITDRPMIWTIVGIDSAEYRKRQSEIHIWSQENRSKVSSYDDVDRQRIERVASMIVGWKNTVLNGDSETPFTIENVIAALDAYRPALEQCDREAAKRANFSKSV